MRAIVLALVAALAASSSSAQSIDDLIALKRTSGTPAISADGRWVAYAVRETNWTDNTYETEIWLADSRAAGSGRQLTMAKKSSLQPAFSPDGKWLAFISDRSDTRQLYRLSLEGGEAEALTSGAEGVTAFAWAPDGARIAYTMTEPVTAAMKERTEKYGEYTHEDHDARMAQLHVLDVATKATRPLTSGTFVVGAFDWSPDGSVIAFDHRVNSDAGQSGSADISLVQVASGAVTALVTQDGPDSNPKWSPDGRQIAFQSAMAKAFYFFENGALAVVNASGGTPESLTARFDENPSLVAWTRTGIFFSAAQRTWSYLYRLDPGSRQTAMHRVREDWIGQSFAVSPDGTHAAFVASGPREFPEVFAAPVAPTLAATKLSDLGAQVASWPVHGREVVRWKSQDGAEIEGVLHKPADFQAGRRYPLLVVIHGGPDRRVASAAVRQRQLLSDRRLAGEGRAGARAELPRQRRLRREVPRLERAQPRHRRRVGRALGHRSPGGAGPRGQGPRRLDGLEPGRLHLGVPDDQTRRPLQGALGGGRHLQLGHLLREHRHPSVHAAVP